MKAQTKKDWFSAVQAIRIATPTTITMPPFVSIGLWSEIQEMGAAQAFDMMADMMLTVGGDVRRSDANKAAVQSALYALSKAIGKAPLFRRSKKRYAKVAR